MPVIKHSPKCYRHSYIMPLFKWEVVINISFGSKPGDINHELACYISLYHLPVHAWVIATRSVALMSQADELFTSWSWSWGTRERSVRRRLGHPCWWGRLPGTRRRAVWTAGRGTGTAPSWSAPRCPRTSPRTTAPTRSPAGTARSWSPCCSTVSTANNYPNVKAIPTHQQTQNCVFLFL